jgi:TP901 family phage tail tape measure protein
MALSTHELYLILRARDEASGVLRSFSNNIGAMDREVVAYQIKGIQQVRAESARQAQDQIAGLQAIRVEQLEGIATTKEQIVQIQQQQTLDSALATKKIADLKYASVARDVDVREQIAQIQQVRATEALQAKQQIADLRTVASSQGLDVKGIDARIAAIKELDTASARSAADQIAQIKAVEREDLLAAQKAKAAAQTRMTHGTSLVTTGLATAIVGAVTIAGLSSFTTAAQEYTKQAALTQTQTDKVKISLQQIKDMGRDVANSYAVDFAQVQGTLYDIFSSIDTNAPGAKKLLQGIAEASVAGNTSMSDAGRGIIGILNAYHLKATDVNQVNDIMFQLVRKGVGTYSQFDTVLGRVTPSAVKAGQSFQEMAGMMAFATRNGMTTSNAASSVARALDALDNPKAVAALKQFGVNVYDAGGQMRPVADIMQDLRDKMAGLTQQAKAADLKELFKSAGGTIQAMRFFNLALGDSNNLLGELTASMYSAQGATAAAYAVMANTPENKVKLLNNQWQVTKTLIGDQLIPVKLKFLDVLTKLLGMFNNLSPAVLHTVVTVTLAIAVFLTLGGILASIIGVFTLLSGAVEAAGLTFGGFVLLTTGVGAAIAGLVIAVLYVRQHWQQFKKDATDVWTWIQKQVIEPFIDAWNKLYPDFITGADKIYAALKQFAEYIYNKLKDSPQIFEAIHNAIVSFTKDAVPTIKLAWTIIVSTIQSAVTLLKPMLDLVITLFKDLSDLWNAMPSWARQVVIALALITVAFKQFNLAETAIGTSMSLKMASIFALPVGVTSRIDALKASLTGLAATMTSVAKIAIVPAVIGQATSANGAGGWLESILGGSAAGAAGGALVGGIGAVPGAVIGAAVGTISHALKVLSSSGKQAATALTPVEQQLQSIASNATSLSDAIVTANGKITSSVKQTAINLLVQSNTAVTWAQAGVTNLGDVTAAVLGNNTAYNSLITTLQTALQTGQISNQQYQLLTGTLTSLSEQVVGAKGNLALMGTKGFGSISSSAETSKQKMISFILSLNNTTAAMLNNGTSVKNANVYYKGQVAQLLLTGAQLNLTKGQVQQLISEYTHVPPSIKTVATVDISQAVAALDTLYDDLATVGGPNGIGSILQKGLIKPTVGSFTAAINAAAKAAASAPKVALATGPSPSSAGTGGASGGTGTGTAAAASVPKYIGDAINAIQNAQTALAGAGISKTNVSSFNTLIGRLKITPNQSGLAGYLTIENNHLSKLVTERSAVAKKLTAANTALTTAETQYNNYKAQVQTNVMGSFDITQLTGYNASDIITTLSADVANAKEFYNDLATLKAEGFSPALLAQLGNAGPAQLSTVQALMSITPDQITQINNLYGQLSSAASSIATQSANEMYGAGVAAAKGVVAGLQSQENAIQKEMNKIGAAMVSAIKKSLGIASPSKVFHGLGINTMQGLNLGLQHGYKNIGYTMHSMGNDMSSKYGSVSSNSGRRGIGSGSGGDIIFQSGAVVTQEINPVKHAADLGWALSRRVS